MSAQSRPHAHYIAAVVDELAHHGLQVNDWQLHAGPPLAGWLQLAHINHQSGAVGCGWCEERGWFLARGHDPSGNGFERIRRIGTVVLPAPAVIADQLTRAIAPIHPLLDLPGDEQPYRASGDDDGLRAWLAEYRYRHADTAERSDTSDSAAGQPAD